MCHFELWFYQGICLVVGLLGHMVLLFLVNWWLSSKNLPAMQVTWVQSLDWEDPLEEEVATHSRFLLGKFHGQRSLTGYSLWEHD